MFLQRFIYILPHGEKILETSDRFGIPDGGGGGLFRHPWGTTGTRRTLSAALNPPYFTLLLDSRNAPVPKPQTPRGLPHVSSWALVSH